MIGTKNNLSFIFNLFALLLGVVLPNLLLGINLDSPEYVVVIYGFVPTLALVSGVFMWYGDQHSGLKEWAVNSKGGIFTLIFTTCFVSALIPGLLETLDAGLFMEITIFVMFAITGIFLHIRNRN